MAKKKDDAADGAEEGKGGSGGKLKLVIMVLPTVLLVVGAVYFFVLAPSGDSGTAKSGTSSSEKASAGEDEATAGEEEPEPTSTWVEGKLVTVDPITINLANGHYLKVGVALQATADAGEEVSGSKAMDALIAEFSGKTVDELATAAGREAAKKTLVKQIKKLYEKKVYEIYWTTFVMN
jgi:flagellar protein FliL